MKPVADFNPKSFRAHRHTLEIPSPFHQALLQWHVLHQGCGRHHEMVVFQPSLSGFLNASAVTYLAVAVRVCTVGIPWIDFSSCACWMHLRQNSRQAMLAKSHVKRVCTNTTSSHRFDHSGLFLPVIIRPSQRCKYRRNEDKKSAKPQPSGHICDSRTFIVVLLIVALVTIVR